MNTPTNRDYLSILTPDTKYAYVFEVSSNGGSLTSKGLPRTLRHFLINVETRATLIHGGILVVNSNWTPKDLLKKMLEQMQVVSGRMFFKSVARKPELWTAWQYHDYDALREDAPRYVYMEEVIDVFYADVLKTHRRKRTPSTNSKKYMHVVRSKEHLRVWFAGQQLQVYRSLELFCPSNDMRFVRMSCEFMPSGYVTEPVRARSLILTFEYPLAEWPTLKPFLEDPRVAPVLTAWITSAWSKEHQEVGLSPAFAGGNLEITDE
ncbi:TPA: hypothetical protein ACTPQ1_004540 [Salmonella enterica]